MRPSLLLDLHPSSTWLIFIIFLVEHKLFLHIYHKSERSIDHFMAHLLYSSHNLRVPEVICLTALPGTLTVFHSDLVWSKIEEHCPPKPFNIACIPKYFNEHQRRSTIFPNTYFGRPRSVETPKDMERSAGPRKAPSTP